MSQQRLPEHLIPFDQYPSRKKSIILGNIPIEDIVCQENGAFCGIIASAQSVESPLSPRQETLRSHVHHQSQYTSLLESGGLDKAKNIFRG